jgi:hypothetical protein
MSHKYLLGVSFVRCEQCIIKDDGPTRKVVIHALRDVMVDNVMLSHNE